MINLAFIPLRKGSTGIPGKNYKLMAGKPLFTYVVDAAINSNVFSKIIIATNCDKVKEITNEYYHQAPKVVVYDRTDKNATNESSTESVMLEYINQERAFDTFTLIQATSPLLKAKHLQNAFAKFLNNNFDSLLSVVSQKRFIWKEDNDLALAVNYNPAFRPRRQEFQGYLVENGAFYITKKTQLIKSKNRISGKTGVYEMPETSYFEIDEESDWVIIEELIKVDIQLHSNASIIKLVLTDVDGVLTDDGMYYSENGDELKKFNTRDGKGFELLRKEGIKTGIITSEDTKIVQNRARKLKVDYLFQGISDKWQVVSNLMKELNLNYDEVAYIGDDINDLSVLSNLKYSFCPADATEQNKLASNYILLANGGAGCFREMAERILSNSF